MVPACGVGAVRGVVMRSADQDRDRLVEVRGEGGEIACALFPIPVAVPYPSLPHTSVPRPAAAA